MAAQPRAVRERGPARRLSGGKKIEEPHMSHALTQRIVAELNQIRLIDPHSHINPHSAASKTLADILGYHYYTELAHSAGLPRDEIEEQDLAPKDKVARLVPKLR